jgi:hypothetical protein
MMGERSYEVIMTSDLRKLAGFAQAHRDRWFRDEKPTKIFEHRFLCSALCQGAALHFLDGKSGFKDFDIFEFYADVSDVTIPHRTRWCYDFGPSKFGREEDPAIHPEFEGRRIDLFVRALPVEMNADPVEAVRSWLQKGRASTPRFLSKKAVVVLEPDHLLGKVIWP